MENTQTLLDAIKKAKAIDSDYALAKELRLNSGLISNYYAGKRLPNEFACLQIAKALSRGYDEISAIVRIEAEKNDERREIWRNYYKSIGGYAASIAFFLVSLMEILSSLRLNYPG